MGIIRMLLALAVVDFHARILAHDQPIFGLDWPSGQVAVRSFYVVSGFYMALVLSTKYKDDTLAFYRARILRILPLYWIVAAITLLALVVAAPDGLGFWRAVSWPGALWALATNVLLIGQDWTHLAA